MSRTHQAILTLLSLTVILSAAGAAPPAVEDQPLLPNDADYAAQERGEDCSVIRAVIRHAESDLNEVAQQRLGYKQIVLQRRQELAACAERFRLPLTRDPRHMALVAEACPAEYDAWLYSGTHYRMLREDDEEAGRSVRTLVAHGVRHCLPLPAASAVSAALPAAAEPSVQSAPATDGEIPPPPLAE